MKNRSQVKEDRTPSSIILRIIRQVGENWAPMSTRNERQYREYISSWGDWEYPDGAWRETRNPTDSEIDVADGGAHAVDFGKYANETYGEVLTKQPLYMVYITTEDQRNHYEAKEFANRTKRRRSENAWRSRHRLDS